MNGISNDGIKAADRLEKTVRSALLLDAYGPLLTQRQLRTLQLFFEEDCTLSEIAELNRSSRQAVYDLIRRGLAQMEAYEASLGLVAAAARRGELIAKIAAVVNNSALSQREIDRINRLLAGI